MWFIAGTTCRLYGQHVVFQTRDGIHQGILHSVRDGGILVRPVGGSTTRACRHRGEVGLVVVRSSDVTGAQKQDVGAGARPGGRQSRSFSYGLQNERERDKVRRQRKNRNWKWTER